jgi:hypothetical protein
MKKRDAYGDLMTTQTAITIIQELNIDTPMERLEFVLDLGWRLLLEKVVSGRLQVNKEASLQLHLGNIFYHLGELLCIEKNERFEIELETAHDGKNIDIVCSFGELKAAVELKCFRKHSNRAKDMDMYNVLKDLERIGNYQEFQIRRFFCLTDDPYYAKAPHDGHASIVSLRNGTTYEGGKPITPSWIGSWKDKSYHAPITLNRNVTMNWFATKEKWHWLVVRM